MSPRTLGLDLGRTTGWCIVDAEGYVAGGEWKLTGEHGEAAFFLARSVQLARVYKGFDFVAWEEPAFYRGPSSRFHLRMEGALLYVLEDMELPYCTVPVSTLKKFAVGSGNATKPQMIQRAKAVTGMEMSEHESDALFVARWALENAAVEVGNHSTGD